MKATAFLTLFTVLALPAVVSAQVGTAFTYQGRLDFQGAPADGTFDLAFAVYDGPAGGAPLAPSITVEDVPVSDGAFTVELDFGDVFSGNQLWLEVAARPGASTAQPVTLAPRHELTATPYAARARVAGEAVLATQALSAAVADAVAPNAVDGGGIADGSVGAADINSAQVQQRVSGGCGEGFAIRDIGADGSVVCEPAGGVGYAQVAVVALAGGDFTSPVDAMNAVPTWCGTPSDTNRCLIKIMPGTYVLSGSLELLYDVDIEGSGRRSTRIEKPGQVIVCNDTTFASEIRDLSVVATGLGGQSFSSSFPVCRPELRRIDFESGFLGVDITDGSVALLREVHVQVDSEVTDVRAIGVFGASIGELHDVEAQAATTAADASAVGLLVGHSSRVTGADCVIGVEADFEAFGVWVTNGNSLELRDSRVEAAGATKTRGVFVDEFSDLTSIDLDGVHVDLFADPPSATPSGVAAIRLAGSANTVSITDSTLRGTLGIFSSEVNSRVSIHRSVVEGRDYALAALAAGLTVDIADSELMSVTAEPIIGNTDAPTVRVRGSLLSGAAIATVPNFVCAGVWDEDFMFYPSTCP